MPATERCVAWENTSQGLDMRQWFQDGEQEANSVWQEPVGDIAQCLIEMMLHEHIVCGIGCLAATSQNWHAAVLSASDLWEQEAKKRWGVWLDPGELNSHTHLISQLPQAGIAQDKCADMPESWKKVYIHWNNAVGQAVMAANAALNVTAFRQAKSAPQCLWNSAPDSPQIEYSAWKAALDAMTSSRMGPDDIERYFLSADNALLNLLGVHFMMLGPWASAAVTASFPEVSDTRKIEAMVKLCNCAQTRVAIRWWEIGVLMMGAGWRTSDQMHTVEGTLSEIIHKHDLWRLLLRGPQLEVRRIVLETAD